MQNVFLWTLWLVSVCVGIEYEAEVPPGEVYWPFARAQLPSNARLARQARPQLSPPFLIQRPYEDSESGGGYPVVLTPRQAFIDRADPRLSYRPEPLVGTVERALPPQRRPVITIDPQPQLPYGKPYVRVPYDGTRPRVRRPRPLSRPPIPPPPPREFGPFGTSGPFAEYPNLDTRIQEEEFPQYVTTPYAPQYSNYIPTLRFLHTMNPGTGEYDVEYDTANGIYRKESGFTKRIGVFNPITRSYEEKAANVKTGTVSWTSPEGIPFSFSYIADENGYRPTPLVQSLSPKSLSSNPSNTYQNVVVPYS